MREIDWNAGWQFARLGEDCLRPVLLPHDAMLAEPRTKESPGGINTGWFEGHDYRYVRQFDAPEDWRGRTAVLEFEGVYRNAEVFLNGRKIGGRPYGYSGFFCPMDDALNYGGENTLEVIARNADQPNSRWYSGAGIYRPVWLHLAAGKNYLPPRSLRVRTLALNPVRLEITVKTVGCGPVTVELLDGGRPLGSWQAESDGSQATFTVTAPGLQPWSPDCPRLYTCRARFDGDETSCTFGARTIQWGTDKGFAVNGQRVILRGACIHHDNGPLGAACWPDAVERKVRLLQKNGYNAIRSAHNPCSKALLDACDRLGMLVMDEYVDCWYIHKTKNDHVKYFADWWQRDLADMAEKDFNHPCVVIYSTGNEVSETAQPKGIELTGRMTRYLHGCDPTRPVTCGVNIFFNLLSSLGFGVYSDEKAEKEAEKPVGSQFFNDMAGLLGAGFMKWGATLPPCDWKTRDAFANMDIAGYNYGINRYRHDLKKYPNRLILGSETFCSDAYRFWQLAQKEPRLIGDFVWAGMDYLGEVGVGSWEYRDYAPSFDHGPGWLTAGSGRIDLAGHPLAEAAYTQVAFGLEKGPVLAVRPVNHPGEKHSPSAWKMTDAIRSWSWHGCAGNPAVVEVYTTAASVELQINGKKVGEKRRGKDCRLIFKVQYQDGTLTAIARDANGHETGRDVLRTAGPDTRLLAEPECASTAPGRLCYIPLRYADAQGITKPLERGRIHVQVIGGRLLALGHACPYNADGFLGSETDTYWGRALAIVLAEGEVTLTADDGIRHAACTIPCKEEETC